MISPQSMGATLAALEQRGLIERLAEKVLWRTPTTATGGLIVVFAVSTGLAVLAGLASLLRGGRLPEPPSLAARPETIEAARGRVVDD